MQTTLRRQGGQSEADVNSYLASLKIVQQDIHDHLGAIQPVMEAILASLRRRDGRRLIVDYYKQSPPGNATLSSITFPPFWLPAIARIGTVIYSAPNASTIVLGGRSIPVATGTAAIPLAPDGIVLYPEDAVSITAGSAGVLFLELVGEVVPPSEVFDLIR